MQSRKDQHGDHFASFHALYELPLSSLDSVARELEERPEAEKDRGVENSHQLISS